MTLSGPWSAHETASLSCGRNVAGACRCGNPKTRWWTLEMEGAIMLKEESYQACGTLEAADQYWQAEAFDYVPLRILWVERDPLLGAIRSSYNRCKSLDHRQ